MKLMHEPDSVNVAVSRKGEKVIDFSMPEWITNKPYRTDRLIYCFSSEFYNFHKDVFGDLPSVFSTEYALDKKDINKNYINKNK